MSRYALLKVLMGEPSHLHRLQVCAYTALGRMRTFGLRVNTRLRPPLVYLTHLLYSSPPWRRDACHWLVRCEKFSLKYQFLGKFREVEFARKIMIDKREKIVGKIFLRGTLGKTGFLGKQRTVFRKGSLLEWKNQYLNGCHGTSRSNSGFRSNETNCVYTFK